MYTYNMHVCLLFYLAFPAFMYAYFCLHAMRKCIVDQLNIVAICYSHSV